MLIHRHVRRFGLASLNCTHDLAMLLSSLRVPVGGLLCIDRILLPPNNTYEHLDQDLQDWVLASLGDQSMEARINIIAIGGGANRRFDITKLGHLLNEIVQTADL